MVQADASGNITAPTSIASIGQTLWTKTAVVIDSNSTSEVTLLDAGNGSKTLSANLFAIGTTVTFDARGYYSTTLTPTITLKFKLGSTVVLTTGALTTANTATNQEFHFSGTMTGYTTGSSGTIYAQGEIVLGGITTPLQGVVNTSATTINTTTTQAADITAQWGSLSLSDKIFATNAIIEQK